MNNPPNPKLQQYKMYREILRRKAHKSFASFLIYMNPDFFLGRLTIPQYAKAVKDLELMTKGYLQIVMIYMPAGFGKSYLREMWNAWNIGLDRNNTALVGTYSSDIAKSFTTYFKNIIKSEPYREIFGGLKLQVDAANDIRVEGTTLPFSHFTRGRGSSITGNRAKFIQVDDPIKDWEEAQSEGIKEKTWNWYLSTLSTRKMEGELKEVWVGTRWAKDDPLGKKEASVQQLIETGQIKPHKVSIVRIPALVEYKDKKTGLLNQESILDKWTSYEELMKIKTQLNDQPEIWEALYQQNPIDSLGKLFPASSLQTFDTKSIIKRHLNQHNMEQSVSLVEPKQYVVSSITDPAGDGADFHATMFLAYNTRDETFNLIDVVFTNAGYDVSFKEHAEKCIKHKSTYNRIEKNNGGKGYAADVRRLVEAKMHSTFRLKTTTENKKTKIHIWAAFIKKMIKFRDDWHTLPMSNSYRKFMEQLTAYDNAGKNKHDDAADVAAMAAQLISSEFGITNSTLELIKLKEKNIAK